MRLICPNCGAQYEVPDDAIPRTGRDVQCSNCGHTWFQVHPDHDVDLADELEQPLPAADDDTPAQVPDLEADAARPDDTTPAPDPSDGDAPRKRLDPAVADLLREEAEHEARARAAEKAAGGLESQPDLGLTQSDDNDAARRAREARERVSHLGMAGSSAEMDDDETTAARRKGLLPDIDEINSSLRATTDRRPAEADDYDRPGNIPSPRPEPETGARGFRVGFSLSVLVALALFGLYVYADEVAARVPQLGDVLARYVAAVGEARLWLDVQAQAALDWLQKTANDVL